MEREISPELVKETKVFLGKDGLAFFKEMKEKHGEYDAVYVEPGKFSIPHPVHFREGRYVRNFMRGTKHCEGWNDHDYDDSWVSLIKKVMEG